ncbi:MAG: hypothetical protein WAU23_11800, partial [Ferruginibacter sp.]
MKYRRTIRELFRFRFFFSLCAFCLFHTGASAQSVKPVFQYTVSMPDPANHIFKVTLNCSGWGEDSINLKMPKWMPGYYQLMNYAAEVEHFSAKDKMDKPIAVKALNGNTWQISNTTNGSFVVSYDVKTSRQFVANSFLDSSHGYIIPAGMFLYADGYIKNPVSVKINMPAQWKNMATGLEPVTRKTNEFKAPDFDILYDCPILIGNLEELPSFTVNGIQHRFIGYKMGEFNRVQFMDNLKKVVESAVAVIGDIPYKEYTFIGIGAGRGGIEHLNNSTVSFDGKNLNTAAGMNTTMVFLAHEYFHHYNVKRIRPLELGPFDYDKANRTNGLWVSEGLSVYYEYMIVKRAGLSNEQTLFKNFEKNINAVENNPGRLVQSLTQASYETWSDGPFGRQGKDAAKSISYYDKGPVVGLILDLAIRHSSENKKSLDDVMRFLYWHNYKKLQRGFTDAEFQQACETVAGRSLSSVFEYVYTTREIDYNTYLA